MTFDGDNTSEVSDTWWHTEALYDYDNLTEVDLIYLSTDSQRDIADVWLGHLSGFLN